MVRAQLNNSDIFCPPQVPAAGDCAPGQSPLRPKLHRGRLSGRLTLWAAVLGLTGLLTFSGTGSPAQAQPGPPQEHPATDSFEGWRLGMQAWTFNKYTLFEAIEKTAALGIDWLEAFPGHKMDDAAPGAKFGPGLTQELKQRVMEKLEYYGIRLVNYGVTNLPNDEAACRREFAFAKEMGIETIAAEPPDDALDLVQRLAREYGIRVAIHNHPKPSRYWNPDKVLAASRGRDMIGACADIGHWMRSGVDPVAALKKLEGRVFGSHFGDLNKFGDRDAHDVAWGTGKADIPAILAELHRQKFRGVFSVEFEYNWFESVPDIRRSVAYFNQQVAQIAPSDWRDLFAHDLSNARFKPGSWEMNEGVLVRNGGGYIWTEEQYGDFILDLEFKLAKETNSGVFIRASDLDRYVQASIEVQIHETTDGSKYGSCGSIYDCLAPAKQVVREPGAWNHYTIYCRDNRIVVIFNSEKIIDMDLNQWSQGNMNPDGTKNKFKTALKDMIRSGHIGFQDHGQPIWFRNIRIKTLSD